MRRVVSIVILISMTLHCFSRLGLLSYVYENRSNIAYSLGIIAEVPIALCSQDYNFNDTLQVEHVDTDKNVPPHFVTAPEINLFFQSDIFELRASQELNNEPGFSFIISSGYPEPSFSVFHPPAVA